MTQNNLQNSATPSDEEGEVRLLLRGNDSIVCVLVEGEDDVRVYSFFFNRNAKIKHTTGAGNLTKILNALSSDIWAERLIAIRDADFSYLNHVSFPSPPYFLTDYHDIEMTMFSFRDIRDRLFIEYRIAADTDKRQIWKASLSTSVFVGYVRWYNEKNNDSLNFNGFPFGRLFQNDNGNLCFDKTRFIEELNVRSPDKKSDLTLSDVNAFIAANKTCNFYNLSNGHDFSQLLSLAITSFSKKEKGVGVDEFTRNLRFSFNENHFHKTKLYKELNTWQRATGYSVLKN
jgi:hypothetical protein